jgi:hypothetical protein
VEIKNKEAALTFFDKLFGSSLVGAKTYIAIASAVLVNGAATLGVAPDILTPNVVQALNILLGGLGSAAAVSKVERAIK